MKRILWFRRDLRVEDNPLLSVGGEALPIFIFDTKILDFLDTDDRQSVPALIRRKAPLRDWVIYYLIKFIVFIRHIPTNFTFKEYIPFHLAHNC